MRCIRLGATVVRFLASSYSLLGVSIAIASVAKPLVDLDLGNPSMKGKVISDGV